MKKRSGGAVNFWSNQIETLFLFFCSALLRDCPCADCCDDGAKSQAQKDCGNTGGGQGAENTKVRNYFFATTQIEGKKRGGGKQIA